MKSWLLFPGLFLTVFVHTQGQDLTRLSGSYNETSFADLVDDLESRYQLNFFFSPALDSTIVQLEFHEITIDEVLVQLTNRTGINFLQKDNGTIIATGNYVVEPGLNPTFFNLKESADTVQNALVNQNSVLEGIRETRELDSQERLENQLTEIGQVVNRLKGTTATIAGYIREAKTGEPVVGASVFKRDPLIGVTTDQFGYFSFTLAKGRHELFFTSTGMKTTRRQIVLHSDGELSVNLENDIISLKEVVVTGERNVVENLQTGFSNLNLKTIKQVPSFLGESDIMKVALTLPGVQTVGEGAAGFNVRGGSADQNLVLLNDVPVYNTNHLFGFFSVFNPEVIASANLYKSGIRAHYGGRVSSVFDVALREGNKKRTTYKGGISPVTAKFTLEGPIKKDTTSYIVGLRSTYSDWILSLLNDPDFRNSTGSFSDIVAKVSHNLNDNNRLLLSGYYSRDRFQLNSDSLYRYFNSNAALQWIHTFSNQLHAVSSLSYANFNYSLSRDTNPVEAFRLKYNINHYGIKSEFNYYPGDRASFKFGVSSTIYQLQPGSKLPIGSTSLIEPIRLLNEKGIESALHAGLEYELSKRLSVYGGLRLSTFSSLGPGQTFNYAPGNPRETSFITDTIQHSKNEFIKTFVRPEIRGSGRFKLKEDLSIKASYERLNQYLHVLSNTISISPIDVWRLSGNAINPQKADQYSLGLYKTFFGTSLELSLEGYHKKLDNVLEYQDGAELLLNEVIETDVIGAEGKSYGLEFLIKKQSGKFTGWLSYTFARSFLRTKSIFPGEQINSGSFYASNFDRPHTAVLVTNFKANRRINVSLNINYSSGRPTTLPVARYSLKGQPILLYTERNKFRVPYYFRTDLSFNFEGNHRVHKKIHGSWSFSIYNLTSRANAYSVFFRSENGEIKGYKLSIFRDAIPTITYHFRRN